MKKENISPYDERGRSHGYWEHYFGNGQLWYKGYYIHGKEYGYWECYNEDGRLIFKGNYIDRNEYGYWEEYDRIYDSIVTKNFYKGEELLVTEKNKLIL